MSQTPPSAQVSGAGYFARGYFAVDTVAAISSALGGAIAIVRVSGPAAASALSRLTGVATGDLATKFPAREMVRSRLLNAAGGPLDDAVVVRFQAPHSYTGEDLVEIHVHGSFYIASQVLERLLSLGARQAQRGEFSFRAVRNGKLSITQAQAVADLVAASNDDAVSLAIEKLSGAQNRLVREIADSLRALAVLAEAGIDFTDQDIEEVSLPSLKRKVRASMDSLTRLVESYGRGVRLQEGVSAAFLGLPNAGKSSFFNSLLGEDRAIVSEQPGTTRDVLREQITLRSRTGTSSATFRLQDTAGLRATEDTIERLGIGRTEKTARESDIAVLLVDPSCEIAAVLEQWKKLGLPTEKTVGVMTKCDLLRVEERAARAGRLRAVGPWQWIETSAMTGEGINNAVEALLALAAGQTRREKGEILLTRLDHLSAVQDALNHLERALGCPQEDLFASDLRQALFALSPLIGDTLPDDILGRIFSDFCIGK